MQFKKNQTLEKTIKIKYHFERKMRQKREPRISLQNLKLKSLIHEHYKNKMKGEY